MAHTVIPPPRGTTATLELTHKVESDASYISWPKSQAALWPMKR